MNNNISCTLRSFRRHPGFTILALLTIALGVGAATAVFSVTEAVLLRPLPYPDPDRLVDISHRTTGNQRLVASRLDLPDLRRETSIFEDVACRGIGVGDVTVSVGGDEPFHALALPVSYNYLSLLGAQPVVGRTFVLEDAVPVAAPEGEEAPAPTRMVVISYGLWQRALGADPNLAGRTLTLGVTPVTVAGVLPRDFRLLHERTHRWVRGTNIDLFVVYPEESFTSPGRRGGPGTRGILPLARLKPEVTYQQAQGVLDGLADRLRAEVPGYADEEMRLQMYPLHRDITAGSRPIVIVLVGGVLFLMLLVCTNVANLLLVRGHAQATEDAVRVAVGCGGFRLANQKLCESFLLALGGGAIGVWLAWVAVRLVEMLAPRTIPLIDRVDVDVGTMLFGLGTAVVTAVLFGLAPTLQVRRLNLTGVLGGGAREQGRTGRTRVMRVLVIAEITLSMVLLSGAAVMARSLVAMMRADLGFQPERILTFDLRLGGPRYGSSESRAAFYREAEERLRALRGVDVVGRSSLVPLSERVANTIYGWDRESFDRMSERADVSVVTEDYFRAVGTELLAGRFFTAPEMQDSTESVIVDEKLAGLAWPGEDPIGRQVIWGSGPRNGRVVGVVNSMLMRDFGFESFEAIHAPEGAFYPGAASSFVLRTAVPPERLTLAIRDAIRAIDPSLVPYNVQSLSDRVGLSMAPTRFVVAVMGAFAAIALVITVVGLFGVIAYTVRTRTAEIGIRMALGADPRRVRLMILKQGALLALVGILLGAVGALLLGRFLEGVAYEVAPTDPRSMIPMAAVLGLVSVLACYAPARWACGVDPAQSLRRG